MRFLGMRCSISRWLIILLLIAGAAQAEELETYPPSGGSQGFLGLDDTSAPTQLQDGRAADLQNVTLDVSKSLRKRYGYSLVGDTLDVGAAGSITHADEDECAVTGLYYTKFSSGTERIVSTCGNRFYYLNGVTWDEVSGPTVAITAGQNNQFVWTTALDAIIGSNGTDPPFTYNGSTISALTFSDLDSASRPTTVKTLAFFKNFLIVANTTEGSVRYPTRFRWSHVGTTTLWDNDAGTGIGNYVDIGALGGQEINAMAELYDNLYVFLTDSIYRISYVAGADTFQVSKVTEDIGGIAKNGVQSITLSNNQNGLIFLDKDKIIYFFNGISPISVSDYIETSLSSLSAARLQYAVSGDTNTDYLLCATQGSLGVNNLCLDFQYQLGEWTKHTQMNANAMANVFDANGRDQVYFGSGEGFNYQAFDSDLVDDVATATGLVTEVGRNTTDTASGLMVLYTYNGNFTAHALIGAPITMTSGVADGLSSVVQDNTISGLFVTDDFTTTPVARDEFEVGAIDAFYTSKWQDFGDASRLKHLLKLYLWAEADSTNTGLTVSYANDFSSTIATQEVSLRSDSSDAVWGSAIWGTSLWGSGEDIFRPLVIGGKGRYHRWKVEEDDPNRSFKLYGWSEIYNLGNPN